MIKNAELGTRVWNAIFGFATITRITDTEYSFCLDEPLFDGQERIVNDLKDNDMWVNVKNAKKRDVSNLPTGRTTMKPTPKPSQYRLSMMLNINI